MTQRAMTPRAAALHLWKLGANVTAIPAGDKRPAHEWNNPAAPWATERQPAGFVASLRWPVQDQLVNGRRYRAIETVGIVNGVHGWRTLDVDAAAGPNGEKAPVPDAVRLALLDALGLPHDYAWSGRSRSGRGIHVHVRAVGDLPPDIAAAISDTKAADGGGAGVKIGTPNDQFAGMFDHIELRWGPCQTVLPTPSGYNGVLPEEPPAEVSVAQLVAAFRAVAVPRAPRAKGRAAPPRVAPRPAEGRARVVVNDRVLDDIRRAFDLVAWFRQELGGEEQDEPGGEVRILGHTGLLVNTDKRLWYIHGEGEGADCFGAVGYTRYGTARPAGAMFIDVVRDAAEFAGVALEEERPAPQRPAPAARPQRAAPRATEYVVNPWADIVSASVLRTRQFPKLIWTVDDLLPEGACLLAGRPKSKKSWLALAVSVAVACNGKVLGHYDVTPGRVLYLDLESNQRRMQSRLRAILPNGSWPDRLEIATQWPRGEEGLTLLRCWLEDHPDARLVVIDILARIRPPKDPKGDPYEQDYGFLQQVNALAEEHNVTIIVIHHTRKARAEHVFDEISGTNGLMGAVATAWMLTVNPDEAGEQMLAIQGRDVMVDDPLAVKWDGYLCQHIFVATGPEASSSIARRGVLNVMADDQEYAVKDIAAAVKSSVKAVDNLLRRLIDDGLVTRTGRGRYARIPQHQAKVPNPVENVEMMESVDTVERVETCTAKFPQGDSGVENGVEKVWASPTPQTPLSTFSTGISYSTDGVLMSDGSEQWRVWDDRTGEIVATFPTEGEALADAQRRMEDTR